MSVSTPTIATARRIDREAPPGLELERFQRTASRALEGMMPCAGSRRILVTGGSGCIGAGLLRLLSSTRDARITSYSLDAPSPGSAVPGVRYLQGDVRDEDRLAAAFSACRPEVVFHLAAQRDPGLAEICVHETLSTNVVGSLKVAAMAQRYGVDTLVTASTGKALRFYTSEIYAASKMIAEYVAARAACDSSMSVASARFTHVVDNSIVVSRMRDWAQVGEQIRLHGRGIHFYVQSALECAQLLVAGALVAAPGSSCVVALRDLGWPPISLTDLALDVVEASRGASQVAYAGYDRGYERAHHPATYDPACSGEVSPLLNALEAPSALAPEPFAQAIDQIAPMAARSSTMDLALAELEEAVCSRAGEAALRRALGDASSCLLRARLEASCPASAARLLERVRAEPGTAPDHLRADAIFDSWAAEHRLETHVRTDCALD